ncbi:cytochrome ubiquinol oxidase subunit I [Alicyclobacillus macrosporangiidus]|uniref:Cytochrome d ubiquinol oxidase subunit I n=1 Tax=Alicyclobacillus macrosporangiidus TaxID=392015 RepID=A0A1I7F446_9BACL|nr:cytochrome ubiquinol oxidase subunit I [Alicyclobacillus macrosporangiidus]SFU30936.1 cytochrome d ubiquinol oxidase subunit I [Alicyclobacillus macrosporangiidus]
MSSLILARWQFGITTIYHFFFVPITIGLAFLIAFMETAYAVTGNQAYLRMTKFWGKLFLINFAVGVVTGIMQEFQFGMNWSSYSRYVGDVFGAPLAIESLAAFFLESTFLAVWLFGWDKLSKRVHVLSIWLVAIGTTLSAFWILSANAFMQEPVGHAVRGAHAEMASFGQLITNPQLWLEFPHVWLGALSTGAFFVAGVSAYQILKRRSVDIFKRCFTIAIVAATVTSILTAVVGHDQAQHLMRAQPMKMAASEALWETSPEVAPWAIVAGIDSANHRNTFEIEIPGLLSLLAYNRLHGSVPGIHQLQAMYEEQYGPGNYIPPVRTTFWSFRIMVAAGILMILLALYGVYLAMRDGLEKRPGYLKAMVPAIFLPLLANSAGWVMTEVGRQPWVVFGLLRTADGVSPTVPPSLVWTTLLGFGVIYGVLAVIDLYLFMKVIREGPVLEGERTDDEGLEVAPL